MKSIWKWVALILLFVAPYVYSNESLVIENIECEGNGSTDCALIKETIFLSPGDEVQDEELHNARTRLGLMGLFKSVDISLKKGAERGRVIVVVKVVEESPVYSVLSAGFHLESGEEPLTLLSGYARVGHRNLFGKGKILQAEAKRYQDVSSAGFEQTTARLEYIDPHLFGDKKLFLTTGLSILSTIDRHSGNSLNEGKHLAASIALGMRLYDFSYISLGYRRLLYRDYFLRTPTEHENRNPGTDLVYASFGWNDEDDPFFPRQGTRLNAMLGVGNHDNGGVALVGGGAFRAHWPISNDFTGTLNLGAMRSIDEEASRNNFRLMTSDFNLGIRANYDSKRDVAGDSVRTARHYLEVGYNPIYPLFASSMSVYGAKLGTTLHVNQFGLVDLFFFVGRSDR